MGFSVIPKNIGGVSINSALGPLASLFNNTKIENLIFPSDLGSNPAMNHAIIFEAYDKTSQIAEEAKNIGKGVGVIKGALEVAGSAFIAPTFKPKPVEGPPVASICLFMPESINVDYSSSYNDFSMTQALGIAGVVGSAISDMSKVGIKEAVTPYATAAGAAIAGSLGSIIGVNPNISGAITQAAGIVSNPQMQLQYHGIEPREFRLEFILTPKSASEAERVKLICDSFVYYSLPNKAGGQDGLSGQYLNPPQLFKIQFKFLGANDLIGNISNVVSSALTNSGLGFFSGETKIKNGASSKFFTVGDCVLKDVSVDYTPNGFATYNDGYPVQTRLALTFRETQMLTKEYFSGTAIAANYGTRNTTDLVSLMDRDTNG